MLDDHQDAQHHRSSSNLLERLHEPDELTRLLLKPGRNYFNQTHQATELLREKVSADLLQQMRTSSQEDDHARTLELCSAEPWATREASALGSVAALRLRQYDTAVTLNRKVEGFTKHTHSKQARDVPKQVSLLRNGMRMHYLSATKTGQELRIKTHILPPGLTVDVTLAPENAAYVYCGQHVFDIKSGGLKLQVWDATTGDALEIVLSGVPLLDQSLFEI
jgi:hypothetical protein